MAAVGEGREERGVLGVDAVAEALQFQIADDLFLHQAGEVGCGGDAVAGPDFFGDGAAADQFARFENQHLRPARARYAAVTRPLWPPPTMITSSKRLSQVSIVEGRGDRRSAQPCTGSQFVINGNAMKRVLFVGTGLVVPAFLAAKGPMARVSIEGPAAPVEITNTRFGFNPYAGPGVTVNGSEQTTGFIVDWSEGTVGSPPETLPRYDVSFYVGYPENGLAYVGQIRVRSVDSVGYVYIAGTLDAQFGLSTECGTDTGSREVGYEQRRSGKCSFCRSFELVRQVEPPQKIS